MTFVFQNNTLKILYIDDDEQDFIIVREMLADIVDLKIKLDWISSYEGAIDTLKRNEHDLCLLDYYLGEHDGLELMHEAAVAGTQIPIILLTGIGNRSIDWEAMQKGAIYFIDKNRLDTFDLERAIRYGIQHAKLIQQIRNLNESLEDRVEERTKELRKAKEQLESEITERERVEGELRQLREQRDQETMRYLERESTTTITSRLLGLQPLKDSAPQIFDKLVTQYEQILDDALERRTYWVEDDQVSNQLRRMADEIGNLRISPRDIVTVYNTALKNKRGDVHSLQKSQVYVDEGRLTLLELMGYLINYYKMNSK